MKRLWVLFALVAFISFGCHKAATKPEAEQPAKQQKEVEQKTPEKITEQKIASGKESVESQEGAEAAEGKEGMFKDIHFDFDKYNIKDEYKSELKAVASWMIKNSGAKLSVEGHCDDRGTNEYNLALGDRRAKAVKDYLMSLGIQSSRLETISYGEEKPLCTEQTEECWAKNRRAHFVVLGKVSK